MTAQPPASTRRGRAAQTIGRRSALDTVLDCAAIAALLMVSIVGFGPAFGGTGYLVAGFGALALGLAIALLGARLRANILMLSAATLLVYMVFGGPLAVPTTTLFGVVPSLETIRALVLGVVFSWKDVLTLETPVGAFASVLIVPYLATLVASVLAFSFALRLRRAAWALLPAGVLFVVAIAFGTRDAAAPIVQGLVFAGIALAWWAWRRSQDRARRIAATTLDSSAGTQAPDAGLARTRFALGAGLLVVALGVGLTTGGLLAPVSAREVLRDAIVPPLDLHDYPSPLVGFRKYVRDEKDDVLFTVKGLPDGARVRLATLDAYDGVVYNVAGDGTAGSGTFTRVSGDIPNDVKGDKATLDVTIGDLTGVWIPDAGYLDSFHFTGDRADELANSLHYNRTTGVAISTLGLAKGDSYSMDVVIPKVLTEEQLESHGLQSLSMPKATGVPEEVPSLATTYIGDADRPLTQVRNLATSLSQEGFFSHGLEGEATSRAGHGAERISALLSADQMIGDDEQYAVAMALMARSAGMPARVVMGFYPDKYAGASAEQQITGDQLHAWVEVAFDDAGWVAFDPTPPKDQVPQEEAPKPKSDPKAQVLQPPPPPQEPADLPPDLRTDDTDQDDDQAANPILVTVLIASGSLLALIIVLMTPVVVIGALKARRRKARQTADRPADRLSGGWDEIVDRADDLGTAVGRGVTRRADAAVIAEAWPDLPVGAVAVRADHGVFGPGEPSPEEVDAFWSEVNDIVRGMHDSRGWWKRLRARVSLRSYIGRRLESRRRRRRAS
ncbi:transglutaminaseTgpA domain-containing protein [Agreia bicolorata]|uniref:transglutaminase family protein n=1 Tax=Agreia bicolorata TaxID=110935 RepID=UPI0005C8B5CD|nr:transglutaminase domain-containing protein [Agreia bicolorata]